MEPSFCLFHGHSCTLWLPLALSEALSGSLLLYVADTLAPTGSLSLPISYSLWLSGSLLLYNFAFTVLDQLTWPLLGAQRRRRANALSPCLPSMLGFSSSFFFTTDFPSPNISLTFLLSSSSPRMTKYFLPIPSQFFFSSRISGLQSQGWV